MEDLWQEVVHRELNAFPGVHPLAAGAPLWEVGTLMWMTRLPSQGRGMGTQ